MAGQKRPIIYIIRAANKKIFRAIHHAAQREAVENDWQGLKDFGFLP